MIPRELPADHPTTAELRVHTALSSSELSGTALHSLLLPEHDYKLTAEIDFLLVLDRALIVVEVKGGSVSCRQGLWTYSDRTGRSRTSHEGPFQQANSAMFALRALLDQRLGHAVVREIPFGYLVITPDVDLPLSVEWSESCYLGRGAFSRSHGTRDALRRAADHWVERHGGARPLSTQLQKELVTALRPDFDRTPGLASRAQRLDESFARLTDEQFTRLDLIMEVPRVLCAGGAGTGKTFLAAEVARRKGREGKDVLLVCRSHVLAAFLRGRLDGTGVEVRPFDELRTTGCPADHLVVDEAQDLMSFECLDVLDHHLQGGLDQGAWTMFHDPNGQAHVYVGYEEEALHMLQAAAPFPASLRTNCRNTREITFQTRALTGADTGVAAAGSGPEVVFVTARDVEEETRLLQAHLRSLWDADVRPQDVTLLSLRGDWETTSARGLREARRGQIRVLEAHWADTWPGRTTSWASGVDVKGLENAFVCVIDVDGLPAERKDLLYVALSRPRAGLWVALDPEAAERAKALYRENAEAAMEALRGSVG